jgi:hypothetical protein
MNKVIKNTAKWEELQSIGLDLLPSAFRSDIEKGIVNFNETHCLEGIYKLTLIRNSQEKWELFEAFEV